MKRRPAVTVLAMLGMVVLQAGCDGSPTDPAANVSLSASPSVHADGSAGLANLGEKIFNDRNLSIGKNQSCASCHDPKFGFTHPDTAVNGHGSVGEGSIAGRFAIRKAPSVAYSTFSPILAFNTEDEAWVGGSFWDGRASGARLGSPAAEQALEPFVGPEEMALPDKACVVYRVAESRYASLYRTAWGNAIFRIAFPPAPAMRSLCATEGSTVPLSAGDRQQVLLEYDHIALSIAAFEGSPKVNKFNSRFDAARTGGPRLTQEERAGLELYVGKAKCQLCHPIDGPRPLMTDFTYDNIGVPANPENPAFLTRGFIDRGLGKILRDEGLRGAQKVPTLRNIDLRPTPFDAKAFMHNGAFKSLEQVVHFYNTRDVLPTCPAGVGPYDPRFGNTCWPAPEVAENVNVDELGDLGLTPVEEAKLVRFLKTLSDR